MRVKKQIALLLSGAILTGSLAGCDRTIIEHQFFTGTVYTTEIVENITRETTLQDLLIDEFGLKLVVAIDDIHNLQLVGGKDDPLREEGVCESIPDKDIKKFLNCKNFSNKEKFSEDFHFSAYEKMKMSDESEFDESEFYVCFFDAVNQIYNALKDIPTEKLEKTLDAYRTACDEDSIYLYGRPCKDEDNAWYVEVSIGYI